jgi:4-aminobutyrate aminotransferase-like enzyme/Ser/Thr protein kinase RdoA (MazF antagonist)
MDIVVQHAPHLTSGEAETLARHAYDLVGRATPLDSERDQNFRIVRADGRQFVLKIANATERRETLEFQNAALEHLEHVAAPLGVPHLQRAVGGETIVAFEAPSGGTHLVRLLTWVGGRTFADTRPHSRSLLSGLGRRVGEMNRALEGFSHPGMGRVLPWNLERAGWIAAETHRFDPPQRALLTRVLASLTARVAPRASSLRRQVIHNDWNDHNVIVTRAGAGDAEVAGVVDFGDMVESWVAGDLAVACAYAMMDKPDPVAAAAAIVGGCHERLPLALPELEVLFDLIRARLAISVTMAACQSAEAPGNLYLLISQRQAWTLLERLDRVDPAWALCCFRHACGLAPCAETSAVVSWLRARRGEFAPVLGRDLASTPLAVLDLSVGSLDIPRRQAVEGTAAFTAHVESILSGVNAEVGVGRYDEARLVYDTDLFRHACNWSTENRTVHLGLDLFCPAGSPVHAPLDAVVHSLANNASPGDYGPTIILEHRVASGVRFFTLYGHLSPASLALLRPGQAVARGDRLASLGDAGVNGGWPPHLHFQIITNLLGRVGEFPGVSAPSEREIWLNLCPDANLVVGVPDRCFPPALAAPSAILDLRRAHVGRNLSVSYRRPITMARGHLQYLYDVDGRRFVDCVNNVPHVGHCHPRVVEAAARQMAVLNTNTRYLHHLLGTYADRLCALMAPPLSVCYLVCSGSEANELALRLARAYTGHHDVVVVDGAYHGNTTSLVEISPYKFDGPGGRGAQAHVHKVVMPDVYRGPWRAGDPEPGVRYGREVGRAIERVEAEGREVAAFICESLLGCGGQIVLPDGYLAEAYAAVRAAGGVAVADEVQVGFGRVGTHMWGFGTQGVVPDIVTLGKPIGNGYPLGAVITTPEIAAAFDNGMEYFNTFGGAQVACAVGLAVLDVVRDEGLQAHALDVGGRLLRALSGLAPHFPVIGDVRGLGLYVGVELVADRTTLQAAAQQADYVVNRLRDRGFLVSTDGPLHNVLKIKPPMPFSVENADGLVEALADVLAEDGAQP